MLSCRYVVISRGQIVAKGASGNCRRKPGRDFSLMPPWFGLAGRLLLLFLVATRPSSYAATEYAIVRLSLFLVVLVIRWTDLVAFVVDSLVKCPRFGVGCEDVRIFACG